MTRGCAPKTGEDEYGRERNLLTKKCGCRAAASYVWGGGAAPKTEEGFRGFEMAARFRQGKKSVMRLWWVGYPRSVQNY